MEGQRPPGSARTPQRLLIIEDSPAYASLVEQMLRDALGSGVDILRRDTVSGARSALFEQAVDCVLLDLSLPDASALEALEVVEAAAPAVPVVILTGSDDDDLAMRAVHAGAQDYLPKRSADAELLARSVRYAIERKRAEVRLAHQALHDDLTALPNRVLFLDRLNLALARGGRRQTSLAVLFLDLDRFKTINDSLGHEAGDELLVVLAQRLRRVLRPSDTVARFGGDEFLILCEDLRGERGVLQVAERARAAIAERVELGGHEISVGASVGIAWAQPTGSSAEALIREADVAMYRAKQHRAGVALFEAGMHAQAMTALETEHQLRRALTQGELNLHFQPQVALRDGHIFALEALLRWQHPERGLLPPAAFIGLADETGLIVPLGEWVLGEACHRLAAWRQEGCAPDELVVSVNLSGHQLAAPGLADSVAEALEAARLPPSCLCLEITETSVARDPVVAASVLKDLKELGVSLALDDFGTGHSSLSTINRYPLDVVKIDRSFIAELTDAASVRMFAAILGVVRAAELRAVAEGVETEQQLEPLRRLGCDGAQGFLFARPEPADAVRGRLAATRRALA